MPLPSPSFVLLRTQSDARLVELARDGHERAFEAIVDRYRGPLLRAARRVLPDARAEDALQQALLAAWTALRRGDDVRELRPWLYRVVHNTALNHRRASGYAFEELREALSSPLDAPSEEVERRAVVHRTLTGLAALPERQREALLQIAVEGRGQEEVARELGITEGAVRQLVHRARSTLRAAATAVVPLPMANWAATAGTGGPPVAERIAEAAAGAGGSALLAKAGTVAVLAGGAVAGPALVQASRPHPPARAAVAAERSADRAAAASPTPFASPFAFAHDLHLNREGGRPDDARHGDARKHGGDDGSGTGHGRGGDGERSGHGGGSDSGGASGRGRSGSGHSHDDSRHDGPRHDGSRHDGSPQGGAGGQVGSGSGSTPGGGGDDRSGGSNHGQSGHDDSGGSGRSHGEDNRQGSGGHDGGPSDHSGGHGSDDSRGSGGTPTRGPEANEGPGPQDGIGDDPGPGTLPGTSGSSGPGPSGDGDGHDHSGHDHSGPGDGSGGDSGRGDDGRRHGGSSGPG